VTGHETPPLVAADLALGVNAKTLGWAVEALEAGTLLSTPPREGVAYLEPGALRWCLYAARDVERLTLEAVRRARAAGVSWQQIADELDVSRQAAAQRYGKRI
jgi:hypothetical protein